jgi:hypothetical protein
VIDANDYTEGAAKAALKIMKKVDAGAPVQGDLFSDLVDSFVESGFTIEKAKRATWDLIAVYSARGPNIKVLYPFASGKASMKTLVALETINMGVGVLDSLSHSTGHLYSLPKGIKTIANYGKPYHFWMSTYLSNQLSARYGPEGERGAAVLSEFAYQMFYTTGGRQNLFDRILSEDLFSAALNKTRLDLAFGFAGAEYGIQSTAGRTSALTIDVDAAFPKMMESSSGQPISEKAVKNRSANAVHTAQFYWKWLNRISPFSGLREVKNQADCLPLFRLESNP